MLSFRAIRLPSQLPLVLVILLGAWVVDSGCSIKNTVKVSVPPAIHLAKTVEFDDLLKIARSYDKINALACAPGDLDLTFTSSRKSDVGEIEKYRSVRGYILLQRPDSTHLVLLMPITQSKLLDISSVGDRLSVWYPRKNEFYEGKNSARELVVPDSSGGREFSVPLRGTHIFEAIIPQGIALDTPGVWVDVRQEVDTQASYYVLSFLKEGVPPRINVVREIWIERSDLTIARQRAFGDEGRVVSDILYSNHVNIEGFAMPLRIHIDRPVDGYTLDLNFRTWRVNPDLPGDAFGLQPPPGAQIIPLQEKKTGNPS